MIAKRLKLYRFVTIAKLIPRFWQKSKQIAKINNQGTITVFTDMIKCFIKYGASSENYEQFHYWGQDESYKNSFITWRRNMAIMYKFNTKEAKELFLDKVKWNKCFAKYVKRDWIYTKESSEKQIISFLNIHKTVVVKVIDGACGVGIAKYNSQDILSNRCLLKQIKEGDFVIEEEAVNVFEINKFYPMSLNTLRIVTCIDKKGCVNVISTALRVGNGSTFTDNTHSGGLAAMIDAKTGIVMTDGSDFKGISYIHHPITKVKFKGYQIPNWEECISLIKNLALEVADARFVGWDVVLTTKGIDILEGNIPPGEDLTQVDQIGRYQKIMDMY